MEYTELTIEKKRELREILTRDILDRYDNEEYWNEQIIEDFLIEEEAKLNK